MMSRFKLIVKPDFKVLLPKTNTFTKIKHFKNNVMYNMPELHDQTACLENVVSRAHVSVSRNADWRPYFSQSDLLPWLPLLGYTHARDALKAHHMVHILIEPFLPLLFGGLLRRPGTVTGLLGSDSNLVRSDVKCIGRQFPYEKIQTLSFRAIIGRLRC